MNKRQIKKRDKKIKERTQYFNNHLMYAGRGNGKTQFSKDIIRACYSKKYKYFNVLKSVYNKVLVSIDFGSKDYSVKTTYKIINKAIKVIKTELI